MGSGSSIVNCKGKSLISFRSKNIEELKVLNERIKKKSIELETQMLQEHKNELSLKVKRLLLLGPGGSGKSTIFKQMKVIYGNQYSEIERKQFRSIIYRSVLGLGLELELELVLGSDESNLR
jgi:ABC-type uncharacterized transport system fused permease/ATPase subunit